MSTESNPNWIREIKLSRDEIATLEKYVNVIERADKSKVDFLSSGSSEFKFTPLAMLVLAVVRFVYDVYRDYGSKAFEQTEFPHVLKDVVQSLRKIESLSADNPSLDIYAKLRRDLAEAQSGASKVPQ